MSRSTNPVGAEAAQQHPRATRREPLSRERVLSAALALVDAEGVEALTMRRLARDLGCNAMALYRYAASRDELLDGVVETVLAELVIAPDGSGWEDRLRSIAHEFRRLALAHPRVVPLVVTRPLATPLGLRPLGTVRPLEMLLAMLVDAGFAPTDALRVYRAYFGFLYGHVLTELQELVASPEESDDLLRLGLHRLPPQEFPYVRSLATELAHYDGAAELDQGLDILLTGLSGHRRPRTTVG
ncbi:TetR/AcrR family transcriptional regulator C-terminal domain-containing protein [Pseudactinotalea suaedae]|jgi:AcrR family transcriptional regulator|uniref:TetR/AcrR family transcriptional regulator C-terminal domain-containing protein n=1 Tax=Pseudactinotalea suaedae TaxID=1524924 RepID=UPI0012E0ECB0|nr:TetR/AcrR family transcriptional regulator C-terminal domain-containing protein [Pseudactinotalea suaedae]